MGGVLLNRHSCGWSFTIRLAISTLIATSVFMAGALHAAPAVPSGDVAASSSDATLQEIRLGRRSIEEIESRWNIVRNPALQARVETIVARLSPFMERNLQYDVRIADQEMVNAFSLSGGTMYVTTGMIDFVKTDLELAGVIAHEMIHADRKHVITQMARNDRMTLLAIATAILSKGEGAAIIAANALQVAVMGAYSIDLESEADARGIDALVMAGYNPVGMLTLQERLRAESLKRAHVDPGIYRTHPEIEERIASAARYMEENDIEINRKYSLGVLRTNVGVVSGDLVMTIDDNVVWRGADEEPSRDLFKRVADDLWEALQMETAPYDIRVEGSGQSEAFLIKGRTIIKGSEIPGGSAALSKLREGVQRAVSDARSAHPMADYYM
ncbi:MAG: M48 family metalloprotease [Synergistaceae bacterium]|nr:M48 family metalloprotease [Synergistaceae bacterium]